MKRQPRLKQIVGIALRPGSIRRCAAVQLLHDRKEALLRKDRACDVLGDFLDRPLEAVVGLFE